ncbi:MAG TPA: PQQ-binding-like beta-propeller repeat protein [Bryobacteraceae bacterium]|nr:PQQ-binding-like beta-propeller repeat protein [Bryobacteraceae bacterium]
MFKRASVPVSMLAGFASLVAPGVARGQSSGDWPMYNRDLAGTRYSPLAQINTSNVGRLVRAWSYSLGQDATVGGITGGSEFTPIVIQGVMYVAAFKHVAALEPEAGKILWRYDLKTGSPSRRGLAYWVGDGTNPPRVIFTSGRSMFALNARTGKIDPGFGKEGEVDLGVPYDSAPIVFKNMLFVGANTPEAPAVGPAGNTRAYDARTGAKVWEFHSVPQPGEMGHGTWDGDSWRGRSGVNNWGFSMTVDAARGIVYTVFGGPNTNYWGGDRKGQNLFANSVVAIDAGTGKLKWYFQAVHHDLWDYDLPPAPALLDVTVRGKKTPLLVQTAKTGWMYILDRTTGKPVFGIEERPVPASKVPGEQSWPTQPIPVKPGPLARVSFKPEDIVTAEDTNAEHAKFCRDLMARSGGFYNDGPYTPYVFREAGVNQSDKPSAATPSTILFPGSVGGVNWGGTASDPALGYTFVNSMDEASIGWVEKKADGARVLFDRNSIVGPTSRFQWSEGDPRSGNISRAGEHAWPCQKPPWGQLMAVNLKTGEFAWKISLGVTDELPEGRRNTGRLNMGGPMATAGRLVFIGASNDHRFRAFDSRTGKQLWETRLDYSAHAVPITFLGKNGKQYVAITAAGASALDDPGPPGKDALMVFALP